MVQKTKQKNINKSAFSLIEMSIVLLVISIIISGMLTVSSVAVNNEKIRITKERMGILYRALGNFMVKNYRLPCPASLTTAKNSGGYGQELGTSGTCTGGYTSSTLSTIPMYGMVPAATLGLPDEYGEDGFGSKIAYIVYQQYTKAEYPTASNNNGFSYTTTTSAMPALITMPGATITGQNAFILISFGPNKYGAFNANSSTQNSSSGASTYELQNMLSNISGSTASFGIVSANTGTLTFTIAEQDSAVFDDIVFAKTRDAMLGDFNALFLAPCVATSGYVDAFYGTKQYRNTNCTAPNTSIIPSIKCGPFGVSITDQACP